MARTWDFLYTCERRDVHDTCLVLTYKCIRNGIIKTVQLTISKNISLVVHTCVYVHVLAFWNQCEAFSGGLWHSRTGSYIVLSHLQCFCVFRRNQHVLCVYGEESRSLSRWMGVLLDPSRYDTEVLFWNIFLPSHSWHSRCYAITVLIIFHVVLPLVFLGFLTQ